MSMQEHGSDEQFCCAWGYYELLRAAEEFAKGIAAIGEEHKELKLDDALSFASTHAVTFLEQNRKVPA